MPLVLYFKPGILVESEIVPRRDAVKKEGHDGENRGAENDDTGLPAASCDVGSGLHACGVRFY